MSGRCNYGLCDRVSVYVLTPNGDARPAGVCTSIQHVGAVTKALLQIDGVTSVTTTRKGAT